jgi:AhpD family alkylhydroperoxidase
MTQRLNYTTIAPAGTKALRGVYGYIAESGLPSSLVNLVYLRVSQINGSAYGIDMHSRDLIKEGLAVEKLVLVQAWREAGGLFDARERAAMAWAETVTRVADTAVPDSEFMAASVVFSEKELTGLPLVERKERLKGLPVAGAAIRAAAGAGVGMATSDRTDRQGSSRSRSRSRCHHLRIASTGAEGSLELELARAFHQRVMGFEIPTAPFAL